MLPNCAKKAWFCDWLSIVVCIIRNFEFKPFKFKESNLSRWFLLDKGDIDADGDVDIILSAFTYTFTPVPEEFSSQWQENNVDILLLKNQLK